MLQHHGENGEEKEAPCWGLSGMTPPPAVQHSGEAWVHAQVTL